MTGAKSFSEERARREELDGTRGVLDYPSVVRRWYEQRWDPFKISLEEDAATFNASSDEQKQAVMLPFWHRISAENLVAGLMNNLILAAPSEKAALALATQQSDEDLHVQSIVRVYEEVFGMKGGEAAILKEAKSYRDPATEVAYSGLTMLVSPLGKNSDPLEFLRGETGYSLAAEGSIARTAQLYSSHLMPGYPGSREGQRNVQRDEARHIQIGIIAAREALADNYSPARDAIMDVITFVTDVMHQAMAVAKESQDTDRYLVGYGVSFEEFLSTAAKFLLMRLKTVGLDSDADDVKRKLFGRGVQPRILTARAVTSTTVSKAIKA